MPDSKMATRSEWLGGHDTWPLLLWLATERLRAGAKAHAA